MTDFTGNLLYATSVLDDALVNYEEALLAVADQFEDKVVSELLWKVEHLGDELGRLRDELVGEPDVPVLTPEQYERVRNLFSELLTVYPAVGR